jgi:NADPH2:quinone reductase
MRAALCRSYGDPSIIAVEEVPPPVILSGQVRVGIRASAINFPDVLLIAHRYQISVPVPFIPGSEFAGQVIEVGNGVDSFRVGQRVFGSTMVGAFAEQVVVSASSLTEIPIGVDDSVAAAFGVAFRTAFHVLRSVAQVRAGDELIVLGAGGGVGSAAVQLGSLLGAVVTAIASSPEKLEAAKACGAYRLIQHEAGSDLRAALKAALLEGADVVIDPVGGEVAEPALRSLRFGGRFVTVGYASGTIPRIPLNLVLLKGVAILRFQFRDFATHQPEQMKKNEAELLGLLASGQARPVIGTTFELNDVAQALHMVGNGQAIGKVVLRMDSV